MSNIELIKDLQAEADKLSLALSHQEVMADKINSQVVEYRNEMAILLQRLSDLGVEKPCAINDRLEKYSPHQSASYKINVPSGEIKSLGLEQYLDFKITKAVVDKLLKKGLITNATLADWEEKNFYAMSKSAISIKKTVCSKEEFREIAMRGLG